MPVGGQQGEGNFDEIKIFLKPKGMKNGENTETYLQMTEYVDGKFKDTNRIGWVTAHLENIERGSFQYDGKTIKTLTVDLIEHPGSSDKPIRYQLQMTWGGAARETINRLAQLAELKKEIKEMVTIGVYNTGESFETDRASFIKGIFVKYGNQTDIKEQEKMPVNWTYEQYKSRIKKVELNGQMMNDYTELDAFFEKVMDQVVIPCLTPFNGTKEVKSETEQVYAATASTPEDDFYTPTPPEEIDDLPF